MNFLGFKHQDRLTKFMIDTFISNYIIEKPLSYFNNMINTCNEKAELNQDLAYNIGAFEPGVSYQFVKKNVNIIYKAKRKLDSENKLEIAMAIDNLADVFRISVYFFLNDSLFAMNYNFPFISKDEIEAINNLIREKYGIDNIDVKVSPKLIKGKNSVVIQVRNFVSLSYEFIHITPYITNIISKSFDEVENREALEFQKIRKDFMEKV